MCFTKQTEDMSTSPHNRSPTFTALNGPLTPATTSTALNNLQRPLSPACSRKERLVSPKSLLKTVHKAQHPPFFSIPQHPSTNPNNPQNLQ